MMKAVGAPEAAVMELVGHDSEQMSAHYTHVGQDALKKAAAMLPVLWQRLKAHQSHPPCPYIKIA
ncbi:MAG: hypothetical protein WCK17_05070 [Verrucomicrobiota bacterium]